jgi:microcystin degradation protein MlrC
VGNVQIVVSGALFQTKDDGPFTCAGVDWREMKVLALKSTHHFKGWWYDQVATIIPCDSPGVHSSDLSTFAFRKANTQYYPFTDAQWNA